MKAVITLLTCWALLFLFVYLIGFLSTGYGWIPDWNENVRFIVALVFMLGGCMCIANVEHQLKPFKEDSK